MPIKFYRDSLTYISLGLGIAYWGICIHLNQSDIPSLGAQVDTLITPKWLLIGLIVPVSEEIIFRLSLQGYFLEKSWGGKRILGLSYANYLTSALFCLSHIVLRPSIMLSYLVIFPSLILGLMRDRQQGIVGCSLIHCFYNTGFMLYVS